MGKIRVMVVDDHAVFREGLRQLLEKEPDLEVVGMAGDGAEAIQRCEELSPDVVLMDIVMPNVNGIDATKGIKTVSPSTAVLPLTGFDNDQYIVALLAAGAAGYLLKTATCSEIFGAIRAVNEGESVLHPVATARLLARLLSSPEDDTLVKLDNPLTEREISVLTLAAKGLGNKEIAERMALSIPTVKAHLVNVFNKMGVGSRLEAVLQAVRKGWVRFEGIAPDV